MKSLSMLFFLMVVVVTIPACGSMIIAGGGQSANTDTRPDQQRNSDAMITRAVNTALVKANDIRATDIRVSTSNGIVTLRGSVNSSAAIVRASAIARTIKGVRRVRNFLSVVER